MTDDVRRLGDGSSPYVVPRDVREHDTRTLGTPLPVAKVADEKPKEKAK